jgi:enoyl-CoA hydratase/carnithine racemase
MQGDAIGAGFLVGALCDFMVCSQAGRYSYASPEEGLYPSGGEDALLKERFGEAHAADFLYVSTGLTGKQLRSKGWTCPVLAEDQVEGHALALASDLAKKSQVALRLLKQHLSRHLAPLAGALAPVPLAGDVALDAAGAGGEVPSSPSKQVRAEAQAKGVLVVRLCAEHKDQGVKDLVAGLAAVFAQAKESPSYRAIVLASDHPDFLPAAVSGDDALAFQRLLLGSPLPVVAALDSNANGTGWLISQFCDACVYNERGSYSAAAVGQSPEHGRLAAMIFPYRFGGYAGREILYTGKKYSGLELQRLVGSLATAGQPEVLPTALRLAERWAKQPKGALAACRCRCCSSLQMPR